jgi:hypothetical protein
MTSPSTEHLRVDHFKEVAIICVDATDERIAHARAISSAQISSSGGAVENGSACSDERRPRVAAGGSGAVLFAEITAGAKASEVGGSMTDAVQHPAPIQLQW